MPTVDELKHIGVSDLNLLVNVENFYQTTNIYDRLDCLINLYESCSQIQFSEQTDIGKIAAGMIGIICNSVEVSEAIKLRLQYRSIDPLYIPNQGVPHLTSADQFTNRNDFLRARMVEQPMAASKYYLNVPKHMQIRDHLLKVARLDANQRESRRVIIAHGQLWQFKEPDLDHPNLSLIPFDTKDYIAHSKYGGRAIFVVSPRGELFASSSAIDKFHHSSILNGQPVLMAGMLEADNGNLTYINEQSGHYSPEIFQFYYFLQILKSRGVINDSTLIQQKRNNSLQLFVDNEQYLNTAGFLGKSQVPSTDQTKCSNNEPLSKYHQLLEILFPLPQINEKSPLFISFSVVMIQFLKQSTATDEQIQPVLDELQPLIERNLANPTPDVLAAHIRQFSSFMRSKSLDDTWLHAFFTQFQAKRIQETVHHLQTLEPAFVMQLLNQIVDSRQVSDNMQSIMTATVSDPDTLVSALLEFLSEPKPRSSKLHEMALIDFAGTVLNKIKNDGLSLADINLSELNLQQLKILEIIVIKKRVSSLNLAGCTLNELASEKWIQLCQIFKSPFCQSLNFASNCLNKFSHENLGSLMAALQDEACAITSVNFADSNLVAMSDTSFAIFCDLLPKTRLTELNLPFNNIHLLPLPRLSLLLDAICQSNIQNLGFGFTPLERMGEKKWPLFIQKLSESKLQQIRVSGKLFSVSSLNELKDQMHTNCNNSFVKPWGTGLQGMALSVLLDDPEKNEINIRKLGKIFTPDSLLYSIFSKQAQLLTRKGVTLTEARTTLSPGCK